MTDSKETEAHRIWRTLRRPFRYPDCRTHVWEVYDSDAAGCRKCGLMHMCATNAVDCSCPLAECDDMSRVCTITGCVLREVRHASEEFMDTCVAPVDSSYSSCNSHVDSRDALASVSDLEREVERVVSRLLLSPVARRYREEENARQARKVSAGLHKALRAAKLAGLRGHPCLCRHLAEVVAQERNLRFIGCASQGLVRECVQRILMCLLDLRAKGVRVAHGEKLDGLVCGLLYLLRTGLTYKNHVLLGAIEEVAGCLPYENKLEAYFGISSKNICESENMVKLLFRTHYQAAS
jgi:hypothetical protein